MWDLFYGTLWQPFQDYLFMRNALVASFALALGCAPIGVFLVLRRMSLVGDALSHAILPGVAIGFIFFGLSLTAMSLGGLVVALLLLLAAGAVTRFTRLKEDASFAGFYLFSLALGVLLISKWGSQVDLMHILFGAVLAVDAESLIFLASVASCTLIMLSVFYRPLVLESFDSEYFLSVGGGGVWVQLMFLILVALNLVAGFQALGTLMSVGLMMLPVSCARLWTTHLFSLIGLSIVLALSAAYVGLLGAFHLDLPAGPSIVVVLGCTYILSLLVGTQGGLCWRWIRLPHLKA